MQLELCEMGEKDCSCSRCRERPLKEVNLGTLSFSWKKEDELRMDACSRYDTLISSFRDYGT